MPERLVPGTPEWRRFGHQHLQRYMFAQERIVGRRVLDLACGVGYGSYILAQATSREVTGVDLDAEAVAYGQRHYTRPGLRLLVGDALRWGEVGEKFDTIVSFETIEHLPAPPAFVARLAERLPPDGRLIVSAPNTLQHKRKAIPIENPHHLSEPDYATLCGWLAPHFVVEAEWEQSTVVPLGTNEVSSLRNSIDTLQHAWWLRAANRIEHTLRGRAPSPFPAASDSVSMLASTELLPLLPERRDACEVFIFVCRRRSLSPTVSS